MLLRAGEVVRLVALFVIIVEVAELAICIGGHWTETIVVLLIHAGLGEESTLVLDLAYSILLTIFAGTKLSGKSV